MRIDIDPPAGASASSANAFSAIDFEIVRIDAEHRELKVSARARIAVSRARRRLRHAGLGGGAPAGFRSQRPRPADSPAHFIYASRIVHARRAGRRLCARKLRARPAGPRRRGELMARIWDDFDYDPKATVVSTPLGEAFAKKTRRLPGLRAYHDRGAARHRPAGALCQRLSAHRAAAGQGTAGGRRRHPRLGLGLVRPARRLGRPRPDQQRSWSATTTSSSPKAATTPTSRRSTASSCPRAARTSMSPWTSYPSARKTRRRPSDEAPIS